MIENLEGEIWMQHPKWNWLAASNYGRIKSIERDIVYSNGAIHHQEEQLIKPCPNRDGYLRFGVWKNGKKVDGPLVHRFVYEAFHQIVLPKDIKNYQINHINEDKTDNRIFENLELVTAKENCDWGTRNERSAESRSKAVGQYTLDDELIKIWKSTMEAEREGDFRHSAVSKCCNNKYMREGNNVYKNFIWKFIEE